MKFESNGYVLTINDEEEVYLKQAYHFLYELYCTLKAKGLVFKNYDLVDLARITDLLYELIEEGVEVI